MSDRLREAARCLLETAESIRVEGRVKPQDAADLITDCEELRAALAEDALNHMVEDAQRLGLYDDFKEPAPLTNKQIALLIDAEMPKMEAESRNGNAVTTMTVLLLGVARAIERAHGIGGGDEQD